MEGGGAGTVISGSGLLTVAEDETTASLTIRATSTVDTSKYGRAAVTVTDRVIVSPAAASVEQEGTKTFTAVIAGIDASSPAVTWFVEGGGEGTTVSASGVLTVAENESAASLIVRAVSDGTGKSGTADVTVLLLERLRLSWSIRWTRPPGNYPALPILLRIRP
jgi:hypothetical protein